MTVYILRHGRTAYNDQRRYQGQLDIPLSPEGEAELIAAPFSPALVYVSPLRRAQQTARRIFPAARQQIVPDFAEMDFGDFDGRTADEMAEDAAYRAWVEGDCTAQCPNGESRALFCERTCAAFARLLDESAARGEERVVIVAHGGTLRAVMERFALPERDYFDWTTGNACGYALRRDAALWRERRRMEIAERLCFVKGDAPC